MRPVRVTKRPKKKERKTKKETRQLQTGYSPSRPRLLTSSDRNKILRIEIFPRFEFNHNHNRLPSVRGRVCALPLHWPLAYSMYTHGTSRDVCEAKLSLASHTRTIVRKYSTVRTTIRHIRHTSPLANRRQNLRW